MGQIVSQDVIYWLDRLLAMMVYKGGTCCYPGLYICGTCCYPGLYIYVGQVVSQDDIGGTGF